MDVNQSITDATINQNLLDKRKKKLSKKILKDGKWITVQETDINIRIDQLKKDVLDGDGVVQKLKQQRKKLDIQVKEITALVQEKVKENKNEQEKKASKTREHISYPNRRQIQINMPKLTLQQVQDRINELKLEFNNARKQQKILVKELENIKDMNEDTKVFDNIAILETSIKNTENEILIMNQDIKNYEKQKKENEKRIESIQGERDDAAKVNRMNSEVFQIKEKTRQLEQKKQKQEENYAKYEKIMEEMEAKYQENLVKLKEKNIQVKEFKIDKSYNSIDTYNTQKEKNNRKDLLKKKEKIEPTQPVQQEDQSIVLNLKRKQVKDIREEQEQYGDLGVNEQNYLKLEEKNKKLELHYKNLQKVQTKEEQYQQEKLNDIEKQIVIVEQKIKESEKEYELANEKYEDLKKQLKYKGLIPIQNKSVENLPKTSELTKKKAELEKKNETLIQNRKTVPALPFSSRSPYKSQKKLLPVKQNDDPNQEITPLSTIIDCGDRQSERKILGPNPDDKNQFCDDVFVVGQASVEHRIKRLEFQHHPDKGRIYGFQTEYYRDDKKSTVTGSWQVNRAKKESKTGTINTELEIGQGDWIQTIEVEAANGLFINFMRVETKMGFVIKLGKQSEEEITSSSKYKFQRDKGMIPITVFGGFIQLPGRQQKEKETEIPLVLSFFGIESTVKLKQEEKPKFLENEIRKKQELQLKGQKEKQFKSRITKNLKSVNQSQAIEDEEYKGEDIGGEENKPEDIQDEIY